jgi:hypothetical protein
MMENRRLEIWTGILGVIGLAICFFFPDWFHILAVLRKGTGDWSNWALFWWSGATTQPWEWWFGLGDRLYQVLLPVVIFYIVGYLIRKSWLKKRNNATDYTESVAKEKTINTWLAVGLIIIELIIIVALMLIPSFLPHHGHGISFEDYTRNNLRFLVFSEVLWRQEDIDGNGKQDYWTYDISCFYRMYRSDNKTKVEAIDISFARTDRIPAMLSGETNPFGQPAIEDWSLLAQKLSSQGGYYYQVMLRDENGQLYNQNEVGTKKIRAANDSKFAFVAYPAVYGTSTVRTFIVNEQGMIYAIDTGSDDNKIILQWPGPDPTKVTGPNGQKWYIVQ